MRSEWFLWSTANIFLPVHIFKKEYAMYSFGICLTQGTHFYSKYPDRVNFYIYASICYFILNFVLFQ